MNQPLIIKKHSSEKIELVITFFLLLYYLGINVPPIVVNVWALLGFLLVPFLIIIHWKRFLCVLTKDLLLLTLIITVPISVLWSNNPGSTLSYSRAFLCSSAFGIYLATRYTLKEQMRLLLWLFGVFICLNLIVTLLLPSYGIDFTYQGGPALRGITRHKNELSGAITMIATFFLTISIYSHKYRWKAFIGTIFAFIILLLSRGKGSLGILFGLLPILPLYNIVKQEYRLKIVLTVFAFMIGGVIAITTLTNLEFIVVDILHKDMGGNGREDVWAYLIERGLEKPWLGYGYGGFWTTKSEGLAVAYQFPWINGAGNGGGNAHSGYLEVFLQLGWLGLSLMTLSFVTVLIRVVLLQSLTKQIEYFWILQFLLIMAITNFYESYAAFLAYRHWFWILYVSYTYSTAIQVNKIPSINSKFSKSVT